MQRGPDLLLYGHAQRTTVLLEMRSALKHAHPGPHALHLRVLDMYRRQKEQLHINMRKCMTSPVMRGDVMRPVMRGHMCLLSNWPTWCSCVLACACSA
eukprot:1139395-Pelagomonas_calceolata.AAC.5